MKTLSPAPTVRPIAAQGNTLGNSTRDGQALNGRPNTKDSDRWQIGGARSWAALAGLPSVSLHLPRALPWATVVCPFGAEESRANPAAALAAKVDVHLQKMGAVWK
jgi:hypothetical protein